MHAQSAAEKEYPQELEQALEWSITLHNQAHAEALTMELLAHIFACSEQEDDVYDRIVELLVILSRAAVNAGAVPQRAFQLNQRRMHELRLLRDRAAIEQWMAQVTPALFRLLPDPELLTRAVQYATAMVRQCYDQKLTLHMVAQQVGYSDSHFSRQFSAEMGCSFGEYLTNWRIEQSKRLLPNLQLSIPEISSRVGFCDQSYFTKVFRRKVGVTPVQYRKRLRWIAPLHDRS